MTQTRTYTSRPPATARAARRAWDHFVRTRLKPGSQRTIGELFYSPNYEYTGCAHWVCTLTTLDADTHHWKFDLSALTFAVPSYQLRDGA